MILYFVNLQTYGCRDGYPLQISLSQVEYRDVLLPHAPALRKA